jgi:protein-L-isoaspartate(D-aspartate) O-methyltransferase
MAIGNDELVELVNASADAYLGGIPLDKRVVNALSRVNRRLFLPDDVLFQKMYEVNQEVYDQVCNLLKSLRTDMQFWEEKDAFLYGSILDLADGIFMGLDIPGYQPQKEYVFGNEVKKLIEYYKFDNIIGLISNANELKKHRNSDTSPLDGLLSACNELVASATEYECYSKDIAYNNFALPIGFDQTCSQPSMVAAMAQLLKLRKGQRVLEIGSGCGYHAAVTLEIIDRQGFLKTIENIPELAELARRNLEEHFSDSGNYHVITDNGFFGYPDPEGIGYDAIYFTASLGKFPIDKLFSVLRFQLRNNTGRILVPYNNSLYMIEYNQETEPEIKVIGEDYGVTFVPLVEPN